MARGDTECRAPRDDPTTVVDQRHASFFVSFVFLFSSWPRLTGQKSGLATVLGEACGVGDYLRSGWAHAYVPELFPAFYQEPGRFGSGGMFILVLQ
jgi:hypothetical protein